MLEEPQLIKDGVLNVVKLMAIAAKTAPKARGIDNISVAVLTSRDELEVLANKMEELANEYGQFLKRDAKNVRESDAVILIGAKVIDIGLKSPPEYKVGINTVAALLNLGIALGSAVKIASILNVDNRIMYSVGIAAQKLKLLDADYIIGIPVSVRGKNIYFDRK
ncbi:MAG: ferredoxin [Desulfurococcales archaeon ex4484_42]|nr:MAG: ferredoxin [Desulfurococcales archaeon ex4484_42]